MTYLLGLILLFIAGATLYYAGVSITDWKCWIIIYCFIFGTVCLDYSEKKENDDNV